MAYTFKHGDRPLDGITIQRAVGRGGFGEVYYALSDSGKQLALKYLRDNADVELRGIAHVMNLKSPHLITIYDVKRSENDDPFVIMEYIGGPSLRELMNAEPDGMGVRKATFFLTGIAKGLSHLHERGIVHRDLKPGNIFYDDGYVKIGDYGLSKHISVSRHSANTVSVGTVHYMAPEIGSGSYSKAIDIYALGVILYEMLTGRLPYTGSSMAEILMRHLNDRPNLAGVPEPFARVIARALAKDPAARYQDVNQMVDEIMTAEGLSTELASFDPSSLTLAPRDPEAHDPQRTMTTPPRRPRQPTLDVREIDPRLGRLSGTSIAEIPEIPPLPDEQVDNVEKRKRHAAVIGIAIGRKVVRFGDASQKMREKYRRIKERIETFNPVRRVQEKAEARENARRDRRARIASLFALFAVIVAISLAMGLASIHGDEERVADGVIAFAMIFVGAVAGSLIAHFAILRHVVGRHPLIDRVVYAGIAFLCMSPALAPSSEISAARGPDVEAFASVDEDESPHAYSRHRGHHSQDTDRQFWPIIFAPIGAILLCDWDQRIREGRANQIAFSRAIWPAICGYIAGQVTDLHESFVLDAAVLGGLSSLFSQYAASLWPIRTPARVIQDDGSKLEVPAEVEAHPFESQVARIDADAREMDREIRRQFGKGKEKPQEELVLEAQPSFVGRTADAGLSFLGKLLILSAIALAFFFAGGPFSLRGESGAGISVNDSTITIIDGGSQSVHLEARPLWMVIGGAILLVAARRRSGTAHLIRGVLGTLGLLAAVVLSTGRAESALHSVLVDHVSPSDDQGRLLTAMAIILCAALVLIFWPRRQTARTIVI